MAYALNTNYSGVSFNEVVPDSAMIGDVSRSSLLTGRRRVKVSANGAPTSVGPNQQVQWSLSDGSSLLDLNSVLISCKVKTTGTNDTTMLDGPSWVNRLTVSANGDVLEDIQNAGATANANVYAGASRGWYNTAGSFAGYWGHNPALAVPATGAGAFQTQSDLSGCMVSAIARCKAGQNFAYPVSVLSEFFKTKKLLPLMAVGNLLISITTAPVGNCLFNKTAVAGDETYTLSDIWLEYDLVQIHPELASLYQMKTQTPGEALTIPFDALVVQSSQSLTPGTSGGLQSITTTFATNNLRKLTLTFTPSAYTNSVLYPTTSAFGHWAINSFQVRVGGLYFPSLPADTDARLYFLTQNANNGGEMVHSDSGVMDINTFKSTTNVAPGSPSALRIEGNECQMWADNCVIQYSFDNFKGGEVLGSDGLSLIGQSGSQIALQVGFGAIGTSLPINANVVIQRTRYLVLSGGGLRVEGA